MNVNKEKAQRYRKVREGVLSILEAAEVDSTDAAFILASVLNECMFEDGLSVTIRRVPLVFDGEDGKN